MTDNGKLRDGWQMVKFGQVVRQVKETVDPESGELNRVVRGGHMNTEDLHIRDWDLVDESYVGPAFHRLFVKGQTLYGSRRTYLKKVAYAEWDGICANTTFVLEPKDPNVLLPELLPFIMLTDAFTEHAVSNSRGSVNPYVNFKDIAWYEFALPPLDEQRRIAEILWAADEAEQRWSHGVDQFVGLRQSFREVVLGNSAYPRCRLGDLLTDIVPGRSVNGVQEPATNGQYGVLKVSAIAQGRFWSEENKRLISQTDFISEFRVMQGDLLITRANTKELVGQVCLVPSDHPNLMLCDKTLRLEVMTDSLFKPYLLEVLQTVEARTQIEARASGTSGSMKNISQEDIRSIELPVPDHEIQVQLSAITSEIDRNMKCVQLQLACTTTLKRHLVETLMK